MSIITTPPTPLGLLSLSDLAGPDRWSLENECRARVQSIYLGDHSALCRLLGRYKFYIDTRDIGFGAHVLLDGFWETWLTMFIAGHVKPGMTAVDVGANFGYYTLLLADLVGSAGAVLAVEPNAETADKLRHSVSLNGFASRTKVVEAAAGGTAEGTALLYTPRGEPKNACIIASPSQVDPNLGVISSVARWSVDSMLPQLSGLDFLKIDAEGAEEDILVGMRQSIGRFRPDIVLEFNAGRYTDPRQILNILGATYTQFAYIDYDGKAKALSRERILTEHIGEDWLLYLSCS